MGKRTLVQCGRGNIISILLLGMGQASAQQACPQWAQQKLAELQRQAIQPAYEFGFTSDLNRYVSEMQRINDQANQLPAECLQQYPSGPTSPTDYQCRSLWEQFRRCQHEWRKKTVAGLNPVYTCVRPNCVY